MFEGIFGMIGLVFGIYCLYGFFLLKVKKEISKAIFLPKDLDPGRCKYVEGYCKEASWPTLVLGLVIVAYSLVDLYSSYIEKVPGLFIAMNILVLLMLAVFVFLIRKCNKKYF